MPIYNPPTTSTGGDEYVAPEMYDIGERSGDITVSPNNGPIQKLKASKGRAYTGFHIHPTTLPQQGSGFTLTDVNGDPWTYVFDYDESATGDFVINAFDVETWEDVRTLFVDAINSSNKFSAAVHSDWNQVVVVTQLLPGEAGNVAVNPIDGLYSYIDVDNGAFMEGSEGINIALHQGEGEESYEGMQIRLYIFNDSNSNDVRLNFYLSRGRFLDTGILDVEGGFAMRQWHLYEAIFSRTEYGWVLSEFNGEWDMD